MAWSLTQLLGASYRGRSPIGFRQNECVRTGGEKNVASSPCWGRVLDVDPMEF